MNEINTDSISPEDTDFFPQTPPGGCESNIIDWIIELFNNPII